jgi:DNA-binding transcriptional LysR family regulator
LYGTTAHSNVTESPWIAPDDSLPEHPSVAWRKKHYPKILPRYRCNSLVAVAAAIAAGVGVGAIPLYLARGNSALVALSEPIQDIDSHLWLLFHSDIKPLQRVHALVDYLTAHLHLP